MTGRSTKEGSADVWVIRQVASQFAGISWNESGSAAAMAVRILSPWWDCTEVGSRSNMICCRLLSGNGAAAVLA